MSSDLREKLKPTTKMRVYNSVAMAGIDVSDCTTFLLSEHLRRIQNIAIAGLSKETAECF